MQLAVWIVGGFLGLTLAAHLTSTALALFRTVCDKRWQATRRWRGWRARSQG